jgi:hypothetical protein
MGNNDNAIIVPFLVHLKDHQTEELALIDSGAMENFLDYRTVKRIGVGTQKLEQPRPIINADGTPNGKGALTRCVELMITHNGKEEQQCFYVADLGTDRVILGFPWLREWNPKINWPTKKLEGGAVSAKTMTLLEWAKIGLLSFQAQRVARDHYLQEGDAVYVQVNRINIAQQ